MQRLRDIKELTKAVLSSYNAGISSLMFAYGSSTFDIVSGGYLAGGSFLLACSTQAFNQVLEAKYDAMMERTKNRPIPAGRMSKAQGTAVSLITGAAGLACLSHFPLVAPMTGAAIWLSYICVYVPTKRSTRFNTHIGAVIGSLPAYLGWSAATGSLWGVEPMLMAGFMAAWQFPHFYGILWKHKEDFAKAGYKMITNIDPTGKKSALGAKIGASSQLLLSLAMVNSGMLNWWMCTGAIMYLFPYVQESVSHFSVFPNKENAWKMTLESYRVVGVLFWLVVATMLYNKGWEWGADTFTRAEKKIYADAVPFVPQPRKKPVSS